MRGLRITMYRNCDWKMWRSSDFNGRKVALSSFRWSRVIGRVDVGSVPNRAGRGLGGSAGGINDESLVDGLATGEVGIQGATHGLLRA